MIPERIIFVSRDIIVYIYIYIYIVCIVCMYPYIPVYVNNFITILYAKDLKCYHWKGEMNCLLYRWATHVAVSNITCCFVFLAPLESSWRHTIIIYGVPGCAEFLDLFKSIFIGNKIYFTRKVNSEYLCEFIRNGAHFMKNSTRYYHRRS